MTTASLHGGHLVLVVDDDQEIRSLALMMVEEAGYVAIEAVDADDAIRILESHKNIRIVFTDIDMPGSMDGLKLANYVRDRWPPIELIVASGQYKGDIKLPERGIYLPKPYSVEKVGETLRQLVP